MHVGIPKMATYPTSRKRHPRYLTICEMDLKRLGRRFLREEVAMSVVKRMLEEAEEMTGIALGVLCDAKVLKECPSHSGEYTEGPEDIQSAYKLANARI